jgi:hypothetical protein
VFDGVFVGVCEGVVEGVCDGVLVGVSVGVSVGVFVGVTVGVGVGSTSQGCVFRQFAHPEPKNVVVSVPGLYTCETKEPAEDIIVVQPVNPIAGNSKYQPSPTTNPRSLE